jgi:CheY-like chemotaxis protein
MNAKRILIVDDDQVIANIYQNKFRMAGYEAEVAGDGESALEMLLKAPPDLVLLDLSLPGMNGVELLKRIRSRPETHALPVIVFSNCFLPSLMQAAWKAGTTRCLAKANCTPRDVLEIVGKVFNADKPAKTAGAARGAAQAAVQLPATNAVVVVAALMQADMEFQIKMVEDFLSRGPTTVAALRHHHQAFVKHKQANLRVAELYELYRLARSLSGAAGLIGFRRIAQLAGALEALLQELHAKPADITASTVRTTSQAVDTLAFLVARAGHPQAEGPTPPMILVVDDDSVSREMIFSALKRADLRALSLDNSALALQVLEQNRFDLIFLDVEMPKPGGIEVCERLRKMASNLATPVVFVTAHADFESRARSTLSGGNDFIAKPFLLLELAVKALNWLFKAGLNSPPAAGPGAAALESREAPPPPPPETPNVVTAQTMSDASTDCSEGRKRSEVHSGTALADSAEFL